MTLVLRPQLESALEPACREGVSFQPPLTRRRVDLSPRRSTTPKKCRDAGKIDDAPQDSLARSVDQQLVVKVGD
jgi:hypothetical protein